LHESLVAQARRLSAGKPELELSKTMLWKDGIVGRLNGGVSNAEKGGGEGG
jgi:dihydrolipoamide dehydrogenase